MYIDINNNMEFIARFQRLKLIKELYDFIKQWHGMHKYPHKHQWHNNTLPNIVIHTDKASVLKHTHGRARARAL